MLHITEPAVHIWGWLVGLMVIHFSLCQSLDYYSLNFYHRRSNWNPHGNSVSQNFIDPGFFIRISIQSASIYAIRSCIIAPCHVVADRHTNWTLLLCFAFSDGEPECFSRTEFQDMGPLQRVNRIPGIQSVLWRRSGLCRTASQLSALPALFSRPITPACFALPDQYEEFLNVADATGSNTSWLLKPSVPEENLEHISTMEFFNRVRLKE